MTDLWHLLLNRSERFYVDPVDDDVCVFFCSDKLCRGDKLGTRRRPGLILLGRRNLPRLLPLYLHGVYVGRGEKKKEIEEKIDFS